MGWYGPDQCEEHCCEPPTPCTKPIVTCKKSDDPQKFEYTIADADEAWIDETCPSSGGGSVVTSYAITLTSGAADDFFVTSPMCTYCVRAVNECGTTICCDICEPPICQLTAEIQIDGTMRVEWNYINTDGVVVSLTLNGVDVLPIVGRFKVFAKEDIPSSLVLVVTNDCGRSATCVFTPPCCWNKSTLSVSISSASDIVRTCNFIPSPLVFEGNRQLLEYTAEISWLGMSALNGTYLFDVPNSDCQAIESEYYVGEVDAIIKATATLKYYFYSLPSVPTRTEVVSQKLTINGIKLYVRRGLFVILLPNTGDIEMTGLNPANAPGTDLPIAPNYATVVNLNTSKKWLQGAYNVNCPNATGGGFTVFGPPQFPVGYGDNLNAGWIKSIQAPPTLPLPPYPPVLFVIPPNPILGPLSTNGAQCSSILAEEPINSFSEFLV